MVSDNPKLRSMLLAVGTGVVVLTLKIIAYLLTGSLALKSDAIESIVNVVASGFGLYAVWLAHQPRDHNHPYGHGKIESFAEGFEGGLITLAGILILFDSFQRFDSGSVPHQIGKGLAVNLFASVLNGIVGTYQIRRSKALNSPTLYADGMHLISDTITSVTLAIGLCFYLFFEKPWIDFALACAAGLFLGITGLRLAVKSALTLMDTEDPAALASWVSAFNTHRRPEWLSVHDLKSQRFGGETQYEVHLVLPETLDLITAHRISDELEEMIKTQIPNLPETVVHLDPCFRTLCPSCPVTACSVRKQAFQSQPEMTLESARRTGPF